MAGGRGAFCDSDRERAGAVAAALEGRFATTDAVQPETALGAGRFYSADNYCLWHLDSASASGTATRRAGGAGAGGVYRVVLVSAHCGGRFLLFPLGLAEGEAVCSRTRASDRVVLFSRGQLSGIVCVARVAAWVAQRQCGVRVTRRSRRKSPSRCSQERYRRGVLRLRSAGASLRSG